jgi:threonine dehydrogenase-like Zn-dependent dehydrogenase
VRALTVTPGAAGSAALEDREPPVWHSGLIEVETVVVGVCGTDAEIVAGGYGTPPPGDGRLVLGHEAVGRVTRSDNPNLREGQLVVPIVRRPDPEPCPACAAGEWDMCENGRFTEHGITGLDGFARDVFTVPADHAVTIPEPLGEHGVLVEPASIVAKAWEQIERIGARAHWNPRTVLVTGAGPVGLLAALLGRQRGFAVDVLDRVTSGPKPQLVADLDATYHCGPLRDLDPRPDILIECTGVGALVLDAIDPQRNRLPRGPLQRRPHPRT